MGQAFLMFAKAVLSFDPTDISEAIVLLKRTEACVMCSFFFIKKIAAFKFL